ncbi:MAG: hypothetical protein JNL19_02610 [Burkholderiales bacterium]|nr:hypothetical protein [Burkholderiales bacterium]
MNSARWLLVWIAAAVITLAGWGAFEAIWRGQGYKPTVMDSFDLWSQHRARAVKPAPPLRIALLGASRIQYGLSPAVFRDEAHKLGLSVDPIMLAVNGHYPLAALRDLANDPKFTGLAVIGIDSRGMDPKVWEMQAKHIAHYHHDWSPSREVHRRLLTRVQEYAIAARPDFAAATLVKRWFDDQGPPYKEYVTFERDRSGGTDYVKSDLAAIRGARVADLKKYYPLYTPPTPDTWLDGMREVVRWVEKINARGGKVVFYREPVSDEHYHLDEANFPRASYWDRLAAIMPARMVDFQDYPELNIPTPDTSHIDIKDIDRHTRGFVHVLRKQGAL